MTRQPLIRAAAAFLGGLAATAGLFAVFLVANAGDSLNQVGASGFAWLIPPFAGVVIGLLSWFLLSGRRSGEFVRPAAQARCASCDARVLDDWRLCPYCGRFIEDSREPSAKYASPTV